MREFVDVEELLDKNLLAEVPVYYFDGSPVKGQTVKIKDQKLEAAIEKCTKYYIEDKHSVRGFTIHTVSLYFKDFSKFRIKTSIKTIKYLPIRYLYCINGNKVYERKMHIGRNY